MSSNTLLISQAQILLSDGTIMTGDVRIHNGKIAQIGSEIIPTENDNIVDATGLTLLPGVIDPQAHFREPGLDHKEDLFTASCACAKGGVTSCLEMPNTRLLTTTQAALDDKLQRSADHCLVNYGFFIGATAENLPDLIEGWNLTGWPITTIVSGYIVYTKGTIFTEVRGKALSFLQN